MDEKMCRNHPLPSRLESECIYGDGMTFTYRETSVKELEMYLYFNPIIVDILDGRVNNFAKIINTRSESGVCFDKSLKCSSWLGDKELDTCTMASKSHLTKLCTKTCGSCLDLLPTAVNECIFLLESTNKWKHFDPDGWSAEVTLINGSLSVPRLGRFTCKSKHWEKNYYKVVSHYDNGWSSWFAKICPFKNNSKYLWQAINKLLGNETGVENEVGSMQSADDFEKFFADKLKVTRKLTKFSILTEEQISKVVNSSPTKSCSLDPIPTHVFKEYAVGFIVYLTDIINMCLTKAVSSESDVSFDNCEVFRGSKKNNKNNNNNNNSNNDNNKNNYNIINNNNDNYDDDDEDNGEEIVSVRSSRAKAFLNANRSVEFSCQLAGEVKVKVVKADDDSDDDNDDDDDDDDDDNNDDDDDGGGDVKIVKNAECRGTLSDWNEEYCGKEGRLKLRLTGTAYIKCVSYIELNAPRRYSGIARKAVLVTTTSDLPNTFLCWVRGIVEFQDTTRTTHTNQHTLWKSIHLQRNAASCGFKNTRARQNSISNNNNSNNRDNNDGYDDDDGGGGGDDDDILLRLKVVNGRIVLDAALTTKSLPTP
ncbi:hypothetical protein HELRODRAFT_183124 [Helobdella robusta]|uniref:ShKT domain-containing protein n=1 Tax=Helobdella robusta TaxID=6412 RepID=T1FJ60_HELRO|nr:hypothetical protein HELRODRAFT_183124 [Helobdella robusta]ESN89842.1 hypothetical protein HELRODRAFT_183124 [Helobdella robusta]